MLNRRWLLLPFVATLQLALAQSSPPVPDNTPTDSKLQLTIKTERNVLRMSDTLEMETRLTNWGNKDSYIWEEDMCWNPARGLSMRVMTSAGKDVQSPILLDCLPPLPREGDAYQFVRVAPHASYGQAHRFKVAELVNKPGEYTINATFNSFLSAKFIAETLSHDPISKLWTVDMPTITSNRIEISVRQ